MRFAVAAAAIVDIAAVGAIVVGAADVVVDVVDAVGVAA